MLITDSAELAAYCKELESARYVAVDTEFMRERTYRAELCLIQLAAPGLEAVAVDPLARGMDLSPLFAVMSNPAIVKVFHAARQDLEIFYELMGQVPAPLFDTQVAAMVCGFGEQVGFATLAATIARVSVDKSSQYSDWSLRPLSDQQLQYALDDVIHLCTIFEALEEKLSENERILWLAEEMETLASPSTYVTEPMDAWRRVKHRRAKPRALAVLQELAAWREVKADKTNVPRGRIIRDEPLVEIASAAPSTKDQLSRIRGLGSNAVNGSMGSEILAAVKRGLAIPKDDWPRLTPRPELPGGARELVALLQALLKLRCEEQDVAPKMVATRDDLEQLLIDKNADIKFLTGWRRELFGEDALALMEGKIALTGAADGLQVLRTDGAEA
ncbi:MAG: ribonuclease D [Chloroflexi bacterium]|nr:ribonuclease D [Chloroflexota bacterium]